MINLFAAKGLNGGVNGPVTWDVTGGVDGYAGGGSEDLIPDILWELDISEYERNSGSGLITQMQVTGITAPTQIFVSWPGLTAGNVRYRVSNNTFTVDDFNLNSGSYSTLTKGASFTISNNQHVALIYTNTVDATVVVSLNAPTADGTLIAYFTGFVYFEPV